MAENPKNWPDVPSWVVWGSLIGTCGKVVIESAVAGDFGRAFVGLLLGIGLIAMALHWRQVNPNWAIPAFMAGLLALVVDPYVEQRRWPFDWLAAEFRPATAHDIAAELAPIIEAQRHSVPQPATSQGDLAEMKRQLDAALKQIKQYQVESEQTIWNGISVACTMKLLNQIESNNPSLGLSKTIILMTAAAPVVRLRHNLHSVFEEVTHNLAEKQRQAAPGSPFVAPFLFGPPIDYVQHLDAPRLREAGVPGITVHGKGVAADFLAQALSSIFLTHRTAELPKDELLAYYHTVSNLSSYDTVIWLEIGDGSPWMNSQNCWG